jgi:EAL domain-containing protein (putative c-di-GMP-specific phosphodiesterase class I)
MQGFLFSKPLPAQEIERVFLSRRGSASGGIVAA